MSGALTCRPEAQSHGCNWIGKSVGNWVLVCQDLRGGKIILFTEVLPCMKAKLNAGLTHL